MPLLELAEYLGHTSTKMTEKYARAEKGYYAMLQKQKMMTNYANY